MAVSNYPTSPNHTTGDLLSLFPLESDEPLARVNDAPVVFTRVRIDASMIVDVEDPRPRQRSSDHIERLERRMLRVVRPYAIAFRSRPPETVDKVRLSLLLAIVIATGGAAIAMHALRSVDGVRPTTSVAQPGATAATPLAVTASTPLTPTVPVVGVPQVTATRILDTAPVVQSRGTTVNRPARGAASARFNGRLIITSEPTGATVLINQRPVGVTPLDLSRYPASSYAVWVQQEGYQRWTAGVSVPANAVTRVRAQLRKAN
jgi:hypothetical protein